MVANVELFNGNLSEVLSWQFFWNSGMAVYLKFCNVRLSC